MPVEKYIGTIKWIHPADGAEGSAELLRCVIRPNEKKIVFDFIFDRRKYDV